MSPHLVCGLIRQNNNKNRAIEPDFSDVFGPLPFDYPELINQLNLSDDDDDDDEDNDDVAGPREFEVLRVVGRGGFGKVYQVRKIGGSEIFAMKVVRKDRVLEKNHANYINSEREILAAIHHPFIVSLRYSFQVSIFVPSNILILPNLIINQLIC